jgi:RNA polymerase sigma factor (sigma-70 family)
MIREVIKAAEDAVVGNAVLDRRVLARWLDELDFEHADSEECGQLAVLLDYLGLADQSMSLLRRAGSRIAQFKRAEKATLLNLQGMIAATHGMYAYASRLFQQALTDLPEGTLLRSKILTNLAAVSLQAGDTRQAAEWVDEARSARSQVGNPEIDILFASVIAGLARSDKDASRLHSAVRSLEEASRLRIAELSDGHPQALTALANLATVEYELASLEDSPEREKRAFDILDIAARRLAAELGGEHPQVLVATANLCAAGAARARAGGSDQSLELAVAALEEVTQRVDRVLGRDHPTVLLLAANLAAAKLALAHTSRSATSKGRKILIKSAAQDIKSAAEETVELYDEIAAAQPTLLPDILPASLRVLDADYIGSQQSFQHAPVAPGATSELIQSEAPNTAAETLADLYATYCRRLMMSAFLYLNDHNAAEDVVQETFIDVYKRWPQVNNYDRPYPYLLTLLRQNVIHFLRGQPNFEHEEALHVQYMDFQPSELEQLPSAEPEAVSLFERSAIVAALNTLPPRQREVIVLQYYGGLTAAELADVMGANEEATARISAEAMSSLSKAVREAEGSAERSEHKVAEVKWTVNLAEYLLRSLGPAALGLLRETAEAGGWIEAEAFRGPSGEKSLKGLTGPITKAMERLADAGQLPAELPIPVRAQYDSLIHSWRRAVAFVMPPDLVQVFRSAFKRFDG